MNLISAISSVLIHALLYFFVFQMQRLRNKLSSSSLLEHLSRRRKLVVEMIVIYSLLFVFNVGLNVAC